MAMPPSGRFHTQLPSAARRFCTAEGPGPGFGGQSAGISPVLLASTTFPVASSSPPPRLLIPVLTEKAQLPSAASRARTVPDGCGPHPRSTALSLKVAAISTSEPEKRAQGYVSAWAPNPFDHFALPPASYRTTNTPQLPPPRSGSAPAPRSGAP